MRKPSLSLLLIGVFAITAMAQTTEFTYQGRLLDSSLPATGSYDFEFKLFDSLVSGTQLGSTVTKTGVSVTSGIFTVRLDFGAQFPGSPRYLEISVKPSGPGTFTLLAPRQLITSTPYAVKSLNADTAATANDATNLGGVPAANYVVTTDPRLTDARNPLPGSGNYIQNTTSLQASSNFNISGNGTAGGTLSGNIVNATTQYNIGANRILSNPGTDNLFSGVGAGQSNTNGFNNAFFGRSAGQINTTGSTNAFFGSYAGYNNMTGNSNAFFGNFAGFNNTTGSSNAFFGAAAGLNNATGTSNTIIGANANVSANNLTNATAIGAGAVVNASNKIRLGNTSVTVIEGAVAYTFTSDKNAKENFLPVDGREVLRKIRGFNMTSWNYKGQDPRFYRHYGPMAQEFYDAFGRDAIGTFGTPTTINTGDMAGITFAAIKELSIENEALKEEIAKQKAELAALKALVCGQNPTAGICKKEK